ncbi:MAG: hypothetical protein KDJ20_14000, partial [Hyphomicrobiales bacterium]|nr:hypothetical protein [Hyphomicrobiales bacterium]
MAPGGGMQANAHSRPQGTAPPALLPATGLSCDHSCGPPQPWSFSFRSDRAAAIDRQFDAG